MNYIGSKHTLIGFLTESIIETLREHGDTRSPASLNAMDLFAGTCAVGAALKRLGFNVDGNDLMYYSYVMCRHKLVTTRIPTQRSVELIRRLSAVRGEQGFIYSNYSEGGTKDAEHQRLYFSDDNAARCDGMRLALNRWRRAGDISEDEYFFLLASLIVSVDRVANTASVYGAFLKKLKKTALRPLELLPEPILPGQAAYRAFHSDGVALTEELRGDILYLDPPYNARQYCANYHVLETVARYDDPLLKGRTGLRANSAAQKSAFCSGKRVHGALEKLIANANYRYIFLSYNDEGILPLEEIRAVMSEHGRYSVRKNTYRRFAAGREGASTRGKQTTTEYLHILVKDNVSNTL